VRKGIQEVALAIDEVEHAGDIDLSERVKERIIDRVATVGILECPPALFAPIFELNMFIFAAAIRWLTAVMRASSNSSRAAKCS